MRYSCFDQNTGKYRYFEDDKDHPVNGDYPVPTYPQDAKTPLGVSALLAGRPLPSGARPVGEGTFAEGVICRCDRSESSLGEMSLNNVNGTYLVAGAIAAVVAALLVSKIR